jgi:carboxypeptidase C (cathepsin A)
VIPLPRFASSLCLCAAFLAAGTLSPAHAQDEKKTETQKAPDSQKPEEKQAKESPVPAETSSVTHHQLSLNGKALHYTATAGNLLVRNDEDKPYGSFFYVAYTLDGAEAKTRPVTFLYNGGPGSASLWLHMGSVGPVRVITDSPKATGGAPYQLVPNQESLLDKTDLVFVDAVGTGFSKPVGKATEKEFAGTDQDIHSFDRFVLRYLTVNQRWNSPKYLMGESYGTTRSAGLADALENDGVYLNGVILVSSILNYGRLVPGMDISYVSDLPSFAAIAWYHNKLANKPADLKAFLNEVRAYASGPYAAALAKGDTLSAAEEDAVAQKLSGYTGLSVQYLKEADLRVNPTRFRKELLRDQREILGRYDARFEGTDLDAAGENPGYDPSDTGIAGAFISAFHDYLSHDLNYSTADTYYVQGPHVIQDWDWKHHVSGTFFGRGNLWLPYVAGDLADALRKDPHMKVFSANGYFDLATPFFATEYDLQHMMLEPALRNNVQFGYYPSGHMIYLNVDALKELRGDLETFYDQTLRQ